MPKTPVLPAIPKDAVRPFYAVAGATDLAVELARGYVAEARGRLTHAQTRVSDAQKDAAKRFSTIELEPKALQGKARALVTERVEEITKDAKAFPAKVESYVNDTVADLNETYDGLATRGERLVARIRGQESTQQAEAAVKTATSTAKATATTAKKGAASTRSRAKATGTTAKKAAKKTAVAVEEAAEKVGD